MTDVEVLQSATDSEIDETMVRLKEGDRVDIVYWRWFNYFKDNRSQGWPPHAVQIMAGEIRTTRKLLDMQRV